MIAEQQARMTEDELYQALRWAKRTAKGQLQQTEPVLTARALLEQVRWRISPEDGECRECLHPMNATQRYHEPTCGTGLTVRAAEREGLVR